MIGSMLGSMPSKPALSARQIAKLDALFNATAKKEKTSITLSGNLLEVIDALAGVTRRSAWIEEAVRRYARRQIRLRLRARELQLLNQHADALNAEGDDSAAYQSGWDAE